MADGSNPPHALEQPKPAVLLVDDQPANLLALRALLEGLGLVFAEARSGEEALERLRDREFAVVLLDVRLDGLDGFETARLIRARPETRATPIIFLTAYESDRDQLEQAYSLGAVDFLTKPLMPVVVRAKVAAFAQLFEEKGRARRQAEQYRLMVEGTKDYAIFMLDSEGRVASWNAGAERIKGYSAEEIIGSHFSRFYPPEAVERGWPEEELRRAVADGRIEDEGWRVRKDGSRFWANVVITALRDEAGTLRGFGKVTRDVTERREAEETARRLLQEEAARRAAEESAQEASQQREQLRVTLSSIGDAVIVTDADGEVTFLNPVASRLTGWRLQEAVGQPLERVFPIVNEQSRRAVENPVARALRENAVVALANHTALVARGGAEVPIEDSAAPIRAEDGSVAGVVMVFRDVTERRRAEEARARLAAIVESSADAIVSKSLDGVIQSWNSGAERIFGYTAAEAVGRSITLVIPQERLDEERSILERLRRGDPLEHFETVRVAKDGRLLNISLTVSPLRDAEGNVIGASKVARDITEKKRAESELHKQTERIRLLWEAAAVLLTTEEPDAMMRALFSRIAPHFGLDAYLNFMVNEAGDALRLESYLGIPEEAAHSMRRLEFGQAVCGAVAVTREPITANRIHQSDDPRVQLVKGFGIRAYACNPLLAGGRLLGTLSFASRTRDTFDADEQEFLRTVCRYITVAYERLRLVRELREGDRKKDDFIALLAHELRNPLAPIRNGLEVLRLSDDPGVRARSQAMMDRQLTHMVRLIDDLLDVSRINRNKMELRRSRLTLSEVVASAVETARPLTDEAGHELTVSLPATPVHLNADLTRLSQVFSNLLTNSAKYTPRGGRIWLSAERHNGEVVVSVRDTGIGVPAEALGKIFDMFSQVDRGLERSTGGLGIGLALVKGLVEMHGGTVTAASEGEGKGSTFTVTLPVIADPTPPPAEVPSRAGVASFGRRVLVVDDNRDGAHSMADMLLLLGNEVRTAYDGLEAIAAAEEFRPEVILMDIGMPQLNGFDATRRIRAQPWGKEIAIIALTGWGQEGDRELSRAAGCDGHLVKPVDLADLEKLLIELRPKQG